MAECGHRRAARLHAVDDHGETSVERFVDVIQAGLTLLCVLRAPVIATVAAHALDEEKVFQIQHPLRARVNH